MENVLKICRIFCQEGLSLKIICSNAVLIFGGYDREQLNVTLLPEIAKIWPAGASTKMVAHYGKNVRSGKFSKFDFGPAENLEVYGQAGIFSLKHESSIFRSFIQPSMWFWKCQASSPWDKQYRA